MKMKAAILTDQVEMHRSGRAGCLRAAVLGSDDAIVSTASLMIGVAAASASKGAIGQVSVSFVNASRSA
jgi:VIT1/CCC1 family predicted Fe2+/Mn2+ transporter